MQAKATTVKVSLRLDVNAVSTCARVPGRPDTQCYIGVPGDICALQVNVLVYFVFSWTFSDPLIGPCLLMIVSRERVYCLVLLCVVISFWLRGIL